MKILGAFAITIGLGGGALWLGTAHGKPPGGGGNPACGACVKQTCTASSGANSTCAGGADGQHRWCASSSGCARRTLLGWCPPAVAGAS